MQESRTPSLTCCCYQNLPFQIFINEFIKFTDFRLLSSNCSCSWWFLCYRNEIRDRKRLLIKFNLTWFSGSERQRCVFCFWWTKLISFFFFFRLKQPYKKKFDVCDFPELINFRMRRERKRDFATETLNHVISFTKKKKRHNKTRPQTRHIKD